MIIALVIHLRTTGHDSEIISTNESSQEALEVSEIEIETMIV